MEPKKNPKVDVHRKRTLIFNFSLVLSLVTIITAFRWSSPVPPEVSRPPQPDGSDEIAYVPITDFNNVPDPPKPKDRIITPIRVNPVFVEVKELFKGPGTVTIDPADAQGPVNTVIEIIEIPDTVTTDFFRVEVQPEPVGGYAGFYKMLGENMVYPKRAVRNRTEGKVFVQFIIDKNGEPINLKVVRGISAECDNEAIRVLSLSKWNPGKQRGKPVRVRMMLPVTFVLRE
jgi:periplasmic protein TonB